MANPQTIRWQSFPRVAQGQLAHRVYLRGEWSGPWEEIPHLHCRRATWCAAPGISSAELVWRYGFGRRPGDTQTETILRQVDRARFYVKIEIEPNVLVGHPTDKLVWYGTLEVETDRRGGVRLVQTGEDDDDRELIASGAQYFAAYGLEALLDRHVVTTSRWSRGPGQEFTLDRGLPFNAQGRPNRSIAQGVRLAYLFAEDLSTAKSWSTREAVRYLLAEQSPRDWNDEQRIPFALDLAREELLPAWDQPVVETHGRTTRELLNALMPRQRLLSYFLEVEEVPGGRDRLIVRPFSFHDADIEVDAQRVFKANPNPRQLAFEQEHSAQCTVKTSSLDAIDVVEIVGAPRRDCFTVSYADGTVVDGWPAELETEYEKGASEADDYPAAEEIEDRQRRNADARRSERLSTVFARFKLPEHWDGLAGDGEGGSKKPVAPKDDDPDESYPLYGPLIVLTPTLPLLERHDYSEDKIEKEAVASVGAPPFRELRPLVCVPLPTQTGKYHLVENLGAHTREDSDEGERRTWSGHVVVLPPSQPYEPAWEVHVDGEPQHVIAAGAFSGLAEDEDLESAYDYEEFLFTIAIEDPRYCRAQWPDPAPHGFDALRRLRLEAGDGYRLDYVAPGTVVGIDPETLELVRTTTGGFARDDRPALQSAARVAWQWYSQQRRALELSVQHVTRALWLGDLVTAIGDPDLEIPGDIHVSDVGSCVSEVTVEIPVVDGAGPPPPRRQTWVTAFGELDPLLYAYAPAPPAGRYG